MNKINGKKIKITDAILDGTLQNDGQIEWGINLEIDEFNLYGHSIKPRIYLQRYIWDVKSINDFCKSPISIKSGLDFAGGRIILPDSRLCCIYTFEHDFLDNNEISFHKNLFGKTCIKWTATCNAEGMEKLEIYIDTPIQFLGFSLGDLLEEYVKKIIKFNIDGLRFYEEENTLYLIPI